MDRAPLSLPVALGWIVASMLLCSGGGYALLKRYVHKAPSPTLSLLVQTGPQKEALTTEYLAELLGLCVDRPAYSDSFDLKKAQADLLISPLISRAEVKLLSAHTLYVDYTVRQPLAWIEDYSNVVMDKEGFLFPFAPFFAPKNLPAFYLGLPPFTSWKHPLQGARIELALNVLKCFSEPSVIQRIDVSSIDAPSCARREVVVVIEEALILESTSQRVILPQLLRLNPHHYAQELSDYFTLKEHLLAEAQHESVGTDLRLKQRVLDFRIDQLAFIQK